MQTANPLLAVHDESGWLCRTQPDTVRGRISGRPENDQTARGAVEQGLKKSSHRVSVPDQTPLKMRNCKLG